MTLARIKPQDISVFCEAASAFFEQSTRRKARVRTAYMLDSREPVVWDDYQGVVELDGLYRGSVGFSAPRGLLSHILLKIGESDYSDASHRDIVGEIANQMSGYARRHFGEGMQISPPQVLAGRMPTAAAAVTGGGDFAPFAIPMSWDGYEAHLVVAMRPNR